jgi:hypothetical protein
MKNHLLPGAALWLCGFLLLTFSNAHAQSPGQIVRPVNGAGITRLNPNGDSYASATTAGFTTDDIAQSEVPYKIVPPAVTEPTGDLATGPSGGFTDIVKTVDNSGFYLYADGTNIYFRLRIGGIISGSKGYSVLIDTDGKMGNSGAYADPNFVAATNTGNGNPGFEYEVVLRTNFEVTIYNVDGVGNPVALTPAYSLNSHSQIAVALSTDGNNPDYFYDWYVPLAAIGNPASIRLAATTVTSPTSALQGSRSDIYGIDDGSSSASNAWTSVVNAQPFISLTNFSSYGSSIGATCTAAPVLNVPITFGNNITVTGTWTRMDASKPGTATIALYNRNGVPLTPTATVNSGGTWSITLSSVANGEVLHAKAQAAGESQCLESNKVTVGCAATPVAPIVTCASTKGLSGTIPLGTTVEIYDITTTNASTTATPLTTNLVYTNNATNRTFNYYGANPTSGDPCSGQTTLFATGATLMFVTNNGGCLSASVMGCITGNNGQGTLSAIGSNDVVFNTPTAIYPFHTTVSGTTTTGFTAGQVLRLFVNDVYVTGYTVPAATTTFSFSGLSLKAGDVLKVLRQTSGSCISGSAAATVSCYNTPPVITTDANSNLMATTTSISGTATANASITLNRTAPTTASWTTTANSSGQWTVSGLTLMAGEIYTARINSTSGCAAASAASSSATVASATTCPSMSFAASYSDASTSVTVSMTSFTGTVRLYLDGYLIGTSGALASATTHTFAVAANTLYNTGVLTVTAKGSAASAGETASCASQTISCSSPLMPTITPTTSTITTGQAVSYTISNVSSGSWYAISDNTTGRSYATSQYKSDNNSFTLSTSQFQTAGNYTVKISADKLTGCAASLSTASITVNNGVLPVHFLNVTAKRKEAYTEVTWLVDNEKNVNRYEVERSFDCARFQKIAAVPYTPAAGTNSYRFQDHTHSSGIVCYRIKQVDNDERFLYSYVVAVKQEETTKISLWPNPAHAATTVTIQSNTSEPATLELLDLKGKKHFQKSILLRPQENRYALKLASLASGLYIIKIATPQQVYYQKLVVE